MYVNPKIKDLLKKTFNIDNLKTIGLDTQGSTLTITLALKNGTKTLADLQNHFWNHGRDKMVLGL